MKSKTFCYTDERNDDFAGVKRKPYIIDDKYKYFKKNIFWKIGEFVVYRIIMKPFAYIYLKCKFHHKVIGKKILKDCKGAFVYGNHTLMAGDAFIPNVLSNRKTYNIVHSDNIAVPATRWFIEMCGAIPTPNTLTASKNFVAVINKRIESGAFVMVYPEAHIWPYYTGIRNFESVSFKYPIGLGVPAYALTNTFHKRRFSKTPKVITYIDGPFFADKSLSKKEQETSLREQVYTAMCKRAKLNTYNVHTYIKGEPKID